MLINSFNVMWRNRMKSIRSFSGIVLSVTMLMSTMSADAFSWKTPWNAAGNLINSAKEAVVKNVGAINVKEAASNGIKNTAGFFAAQANNVSSYVKPTLNAVAGAVKDIVAAHPTATKVAVVAAVAPTIVAGAVAGTMKGAQAVVDYKINQQKKLIASLADEMRAITNVIAKNIESHQAQPFKVTHDWKSFEANLAKLSHVEFKGQLQTLMSKIRRMYDVTIDYANGDTRKVLSSFVQECLDIHQAAQNLLNILNNQKTIADSVKQTCYKAGCNVSDAARFAGAKAAQTGQAIKQACGNACSKVGSNVAAAARFTGAKAVQANQAVKNAVSPYMTKRNALIAGGVAAAVGAGVAYKTGAAQAFIDAAGKEIKNLKHVNWSNLMYTTGQNTVNGVKHCGNKIAAGVTGLAAYLPTFGKKAIETDIKDYNDFLDQAPTVLAEQPNNYDYIDEAFNILQEDAVNNQTANTITTVMQDAADYMQQPTDFAQDGIVEVVNPAHVDAGLNSIAAAADLNEKCMTGELVADLYPAEEIVDVDELAKFVDAIATNDATANVIDVDIIAEQAKNDPTLHQILF